MKLNETAIYKTKRYFVQPEVTVEEKTTVAIIGDLHISPIVSEKQCYNIYKRLVKIEPDLIILQGDLIDSPTELFDENSVKKLKDTLKMCSRIATTVAVLGGHDFVIPTDPGVVMDVIPIWEKICEECNIELLMDEWYETEKIRIFGLFQDADFIIDSEGKRQDDAKIMEKKLDEFELDPEPDKINWFISHAPSINRKVIKMLKHFDVMSFGHTHGGCVPIFLDDILDKVHSNRGLVSPMKKPFPKLARGAKTLSTDTSLIINSGLIAMHYCVPKPLQQLNFLKKGEITEVVFEADETEVDD
ncbi:metallophosphoesterase [Candidatus Saccharibacteria bacterium]|nr:metallophosphoesterase [Candidatus Saccharibacteria bacterium]